jgi:very-short-patch-repair endonuclease
MSNCLYCKKDSKEGNKFCNRVCYYNYLKTRIGSKNIFFGKKHSNEIRFNLSEKAKKRKLSEETKRKIGLTQKGIPKGPMLQETKKRLSDSIKRGFQSGRKVWNAGLTKELNKSILSTANKLSAIGKTKIGTKNPFWGKHHKDTTKEKHSLFMKGKFVGKGNAFFGKKHSDETIQVISKKAKIRSELPDVKIRLREQGVNSVLVGKKCGTKPELILKKALEEKNISFEFQYKFRNNQGQYICVSDFALPAHKIIIEVQGDFHHANPRIYYGKNLKPIQERTIKNDKKKADLYKKEGWTLVILWGSDIINDVSKGIEVVTSAIKARHQN